MSSSDRLGAWLRSPPPHDRTSDVELFMSFILALVVAPIMFALVSWKLVHHGRNVRRGWWLVWLPAFLGTLLWLPVLPR
jgi:hypothetical protein